jgi:hypothetical protein
VAPVHPVGQARLLQRHRRGRVAQRPPARAARPFTCGPYPNQINRSCELLQPLPLPIPAGAIAAPLPSTSARMCVPGFAARFSFAEGRRNPSARHIYPRHSICLDVRRPGTEFRAVVLAST